MDRANSLRQIEEEVFGPFAFAEKQVNFFVNILRYFFLFTLAPIRILLFVGIVIVSGFWVMLCSLGSGFRRTKRIASWRRFLIKHPVRLGNRLLLYCCGFNWISKNEFPRFNEPTPYVLLANHLSYIDVFLHLHLSFCSFVARKETTNIPFVGVIAEVVQSVFVDRNDENSRTKTMEAIADRVNNAHHYDHPLLIFPEGTIANDKGIPTFKIGAFNPGKPCVIALTRYWSPFWNIPWVAKSGIANIFKLASSPHNSLKLRYYLYVPTEHEREDPYLFRDNVRKFFARELGLPLSQFGYRHHVVALKYYKGELELGEAIQQIEKLKDVQ
ncbi:hypothetical protein P9112_000473 [Eukaryota sp. TZLM1-RC]